MGETAFSKSLHDALNAPGRWTRVHRQHAGEWWALSADQRQVEALRARGLRIYRMHGGPPGLADLGGVIRFDGGGLHLEVETKSDKGAQRADQETRQRLVEQWGGVYVLVREGDIETGVRLVDEAIGRRLGR